MRSGSGRPERRSEQRLWCSDLIRVRLEGPPPVEVTANLEDISPSGACLQFEEAVPEGAAITLRLGRHKLRGRTVYCIRNEIGYFAGVHFDRDCKWSRALYEPRHLLDPAQVPGRKR